MTCGTELEVTQEEKEENKRRKKKKAGTGAAGSGQLGPWAAPAKEGWRRSAEGKSGFLVRSGFPRRWRRRRGSTRPAAATLGAAARITAAHGTGGEEARGGS